MSEPDLITLETELNAALSEFDWSTATQVCDQITSNIYSSGSAVPFPQSKSILYVLRRKRRFELMTQIADAVLASGQDHPQIKRQYAQSLIDRGLFYAAEPLLEEIIADSDVTKGERLEALGLKGRLHKQIFVCLKSNHEGKKEQSLRAALDAYRAGYALDSTSFWHTINIVALLKRGQREGYLLEGKPDADDLAAGVVSLLSEIAEESVEPPKAWELATRLEAELALGKFEEMKATALEYTNSNGADAFEIGSTFRQLLEIWQLNDDEPPGSDILPVLRGALLRNEGGAITLNAGEATADSINLEGVFGDNAPQTLKWYKEGLERTNSIARIEMLDGRGIGTASVVSKSEFFPGGEGVLLMTNAHVVSVNPADSGLSPEKVKVNFQGAGQVCDIQEVVWSSSQRELDTSLLSINGETGVKPLPISKNPVRMSSPVPRVYVIGHPNGRDLEISLNDSRMVATNDTFLHYRTPTEPGSSGSPVFDQHGWEVVALHHGGSDNLPRLDRSPGTYQANEGITISAIKNAILGGS